MPDVEPESSVLPTGGAIRPITRWGEQVMHRMQEPVTEFDADLSALAADMVATMYAADGVGLAACQIGVDRSIFVFDCPDDEGVRHQGVVCNPEVFLPEGRDRRLDDDDEGCLSLPGAFVGCARPDFARVEGQDLDGNPVSYSGTGLFARCLQHETDHCKGTVFGDRLNKRARKKLFKQADEYADRYPADWPVEAERPAATEHATAVAAATLSESMPAAIGITARRSAVSIQRRESPGPSEPISSATLSSPRTASSISTASAAGVSATVVKPAFESSPRASYQVSIRA